MLILTRRIGETLMIGPDVTVTVLGVKGNQVRIGINAPRTVEVHRAEIFKLIQKQRQQRSKPETPSSAPVVGARRSLNVLKAVVRTLRFGAAPSALVDRQRRAGAN
jgi:carbon storage regulator